MSKLKLLTSYLPKRYVEPGEMLNNFPYRARAMFAFEEQDGVDVCFFGMHVQVKFFSDLLQPLKPATTHTTSFRHIISFIILGYRCIWPWLCRCSWKLKTSMCLTPRSTNIKPKCTNINPRSTGPSVHNQTRGACTWHTWTPSTSSSRDTSGQKSTTKFY